MSLINIGVAGLRVQQTALAVTGQNITNANTEGYSRQRVGVVPQNAGTDGSRFRGAGASVSEIERITDAFVVEQVRSDGSMRSEMSTLATQIRQIDGVLFSEANGLDGAFNQFFAALNDANATPDSIPERRLVLEAGANLSARFSALDDQMNAANAGVTAELGSAVNTINELAENIAQLNRRLADIGDSGLSGSANPLLDQRDVLLQELSNLVSVKVVPQDNEQISVFIGKGQALVLGNTTQSLSLGSNQEILLRGDNGKTLAITDALSGGELGGTLAFRDSVLTPAKQRLGQLAHTFVQQFNAEHQRGLDLDGRPGQAFFTDLNSGNNTQNRVAREDLGASPSGTIRVAIQDALETRLTDYRLDFSEQGSGSFSIRRLSDGQMVFQGRHGGAEQALEFDGIRVTLGAAPFAAGQSYRLSPLGPGAGDVALALTNTKEIALASAARSTASLSNLGSGVVELGAVIDPAHPILQTATELSPPLLVRFTAADRFDLLDNSDPTAPVPLEPPIRSIRYQAGQSLPDALAAQGSTRFSSGSAQVGRINDVVPVGENDTLPGNGYGYQRLSLSVAGAAVAEIELPENASAGATAALLDRLTGVSATAYTDVAITEIGTLSATEGPNVVINGQTLENLVSLDDLVGQVNANVGLMDSGVRAVLDNGVVRLTDIHGDDLAIKVSGPVGSGIRLEDLSQQSVFVAGSGQGDAAALDAANDLRGGFDFSTGGPYALTVSSGGSTAQVVLNQAYGDAADIVSQVQSQLDAGFGSGQLQASLNNQGQLRLATLTTGPDASLTVTPSAAMGSALGLSSTSAQGADRYQGTTIGGQVAVLLDAQSQLTAQAGGPFLEVPQVFRGDLGFELAISGNPLVGDEFVIEFNAGGSLDNRNGLALSNLQSAELIGDPATSINQAFAGLVEFVGSKASQAAVDQEAAENLLAQSQARRASISGVNLDEEAAKLIRHEQGYNAAAQIISVARDVFNVLINAVS